MAGDSLQRIKTCEKGPGLHFLFLFFMFSGELRQNNLFLRVAYPLNLKEARINYR